MKLYIKAVCVCPAHMALVRYRLIYNTHVTKQADLIAYVFDGHPHLLSGALLEWMEASPRFTAFVDKYRDKIRKKIRVTRDAESALDLRGELEVAYCLHNDRRLEIVYELYASAGRRGPDFTVTYRSNLVFNIEVARIRVEEGVVHGNAVELRRKEERILRILLDKLEQLQPGMPNLLVIHTRKELAQSIALDRVMQEIKTKAEGKDPYFYAISRYTSPAAFYKEFLRLSGILLWVDGVPPWINKQARSSLPVKILRLVSSLTSGSSLA